MGEPKKQKDFPTASEPSPGTPSPTRKTPKIKGYQVISILGEGGMGVVYLAEQRGPVRRRVALKVIKPGMDSERVIARFETERQALALMDHPNIAQVYDAGATEAGLPFVVMEYVKGVSITEHCDREKLCIEERLNLFAKVCEAVQHAHMKGIIHRDIKPSNILVTFQDNQATPKVIDFGVAKATSQPLTDRTLYTEQGQIIGTPEYMSPEQAEMTAQDIDTRTDIYSLGVLLYELLTGSLPFEQKTLRQAAYAEIQRIIREEDPPRPSARLSNLGEKAKTVAQCRRTEATSLAKRLQKELEWIPLKAMRKERSDRYRFASDLADDIHNYLIGAPLIAGPESTIYRFKKLVRRHRALVTGAAAVLAVLIGGVISTSIFAFKEARARGEAEEARIVADQARIDAELGRSEAIAAGEEAKRQASISQSVNNFLNNDLLTSFNPYAAQGKEVTIREALDTASNNIEGKFTDAPLVEAKIRLTLGNTYMSLGAYQAAEPHLEHARKIHHEQLGEEHSDTLDSMVQLVRLYKSQGRFQEAEPLCNKTLEIRRRQLGEEDTKTISILIELAVLYQNTDRYSESEDILVNVLETQSRLKSEENADILNTMDHLGVLYHLLGRFDEAEPLLVNTLEGRRRLFVEENLDTLESKINLAALNIDLGNYDVSEPMLVESLEVLRRTPGENHPLTLSAMFHLAGLYMRLDRFVEAEPLFIKVLETRRQSLGDNHLEALESSINMAVLYRETEQYQTAESMFLKTLEAYQLMFKDEHPNTLNTMIQLAILYINQDRFEDEAPLINKILEIRGRLLSEKHPKLWHITNNVNRLAQSFLVRGMNESSKGEYNQAIKDYESALNIHPDFAETLNEFALLHSSCPVAEFRDGDLAIEMATKACELTSWQDSDYLGTLAAAYGELGDFGSAIKWQENAISALKKEICPPWLMAHYDERLKLYQLDRPYHRGELWGESRLWDAKADWSDENNPNERSSPFFSIWSFHDAESGDLLLATDEDVAEIPSGWSLDGTEDTVPVLYDDVSERGQSPDEFSGHGPWMIRWTSPIDGFIEINGSLWQIFESQRQIAYYLRQNGGPIFSEGYIPQDENGGTILGPKGKISFYSMVRSVKLDDTIDMIVDGTGPGGNGTSTFAVSAFRIQEIKASSFLSLQRLEGKKQKVYTVKNQIKAGKFEEALQQIEDLRLLSQVDGTEISQQAQNVIQQLAGIFYNRGQGEERGGEYDQAIADYKLAIHVDPGHFRALDALATLQATCPAIELRDSDQAVENATQACERTNWKNYECLATLAVTYSEVGDYEAAVKWQIEAIDVIPPDKRPQWESNYSSRLKLYQSTQPYHMIFRDNNIISTFCNPLEVITADPFVLEDKGNYYLYGSIKPSDASEGIWAWKSNDLVNWQTCGPVYQRNPQNWSQAAFWAPEVKEKNGKYYLYFHAGNILGSQETQLCVAQSDNPLGPFDEVKTTPLLNVGKQMKDPHVFIDEDDCAYLYYMATVDIFWEIYVVALEDNLVETKGDPILCFRASQPWESIAAFQDGGRRNDAPFVVKHQGIYYLMYTGNDIDHCAIGYATAMSPLGPWIKYRDNPILQKNEFVGYPGHNCVVVSPDKSELFMAYHVRLNPNTIGQLYIDRMGFVEGPGYCDKIVVYGPTSEPQHLPGGAKLPSVTMGRDDFSEEALNRLRWITVFNEDPDTWKIENGSLAITTQPGDIENRKFSAKNIFLQYAPTSGDWTITTKVAMATQNNGDYGFLIVWQDHGNYVILKKAYSDDQFFIAGFERKDNYVDRVSRSFANTMGDTVYLRIEKSGLNYTFKVSPDGSDWTSLGEPIQADLYDIKVGIGAVSPGSGSNIEAKYDFFDISNKK